MASRAFASIRRFATPVASSIWPMPMQFLASLPTSAKQPKACLWTGRWALQNTPEQRCEGHRYAHDRRPIWRVLTIRRRSPAWAQRRDLPTNHHFSAVFLSPTGWKPQQADNRPNVQSCLPAPAIFLLGQNLFQRYLFRIGITIHARFKGIFICIQKNQILIGGRKLIPSGGIRFHCFYIRSYHFF